MSMYLLQHAIRHQYIFALRFFLMQEAMYEIYKLSKYLQILLKMSMIDIALDTVVNCGRQECGIKHG